MKNKLTVVEGWLPFLVDMIIKFIELNKEEIGSQKSSILVKFSKGQSLEKIAFEENLSATRIRQLLDTARRQLEKKIGEANIAELNSLKELCKGLESENNDLRITLKLHSLKDSTPISKLNLSARAQNTIEALNISSVEQLCKVEVEDIWKVRNVGLKTISEIEKALESYGLRLGS
jgi:DNA-binding Xre family transcriptional regulator